MQNGTVVGKGNLMARGFIEVRIGNKIDLYRINSLCYIVFRYQYVNSVILGLI